MPFTNVDPLRRTRWARLKKTKSTQSNTFRDTGLDCVQDRTVRLYHRHRISWRRIGNRKEKSAQERVPVLQRWHARLQWRLSQRLIMKARAPQPAFWCKVEGASHPCNFYNVDQVPMNLTGGSTTYESVDTKKVWGKGGASGAWTHRFATLQLCVRMCAPVPGKKFRGQGKPSIIFKGNITAAENAEYHPDVFVDFNDSAWANDYCMDWIDTFLDDNFVGAPATLHPNSQTSPLNLKPHPSTRGLPY